MRQILQMPVNNILLLLAVLTSESCPNRGEGAGFILDINAPAQVDVVTHQLKSSSKLPQMFSLCLS